MDKKEIKKKETKSEKVEKIKETKVVKKKIKKNITNGVAYVNATFNNTIVTIADDGGNVIAWSSAGSKGFKGSRKSTPYAMYISQCNMDNFILWNVYTGYTCHNFIEK